MNTTEDRNAIQEPCPKCGTLHMRGPYELRPDNKVSPRDIRCQCGLDLRWSVPLFIQTKSGYVLRVLRDDETPFFPESE